jgi:Protein of unknown function (DUF3987)
MSTSSGRDSGPGGVDRPRIVATFDYTDENGKLLYQAVRREPGEHGARKDFRQRQPDGKGGWIWNLQGARRVLYRLPQLLKADRDWQTVFIVEGEKCVDRMWTEGLVATTNAMGAGKFTPDLVAFLAGFDVVVIPDNDAIGRKHAKEVAGLLEGVARSVRIVELPGLPEKGDVVDWFQADGTKIKLLEMALAAPAIGRVTNPDADDPDDAADRRLRAERKGEALESDQAGRCTMAPFPVHLLGEPLANYVNQSAISIGCDPAFIALPLLTCLGSAIGNSRWVWLKRDWQEPPIIWSVTVGVSGNKKSPGLRAATKFHKDREKQLEAEHRKALKEWIAANPDEEEDDEDKPVKQRVVSIDFTIERAIGIMSEAAVRALLAYRDELSGWFGGFNQYRPGRGGSDLEYWLSAHQAEKIIYDRKGGGKDGDGTSIQVEHGFLAITGGIQPKVLAQCLDDHSFDCGLVARFVFAAPPKRKSYWTEVETHPDTVTAVERLFERLWGLKMRKSTSGVLMPEYVKLDGQAKAEWVRFYDRLQDEKDVRRGHLVAAWSKLEAFCARLALVLHLCRWAAGQDVDPELIDLDTMRTAVELWQWFANETERIYTMLSDHPDLSVEQHFVLTYLRGINKEVTVRDVHRRFQSRFATAADAEDCLEELAVKKLVKRLPCESKPGGGHAPQRYSLQASHDT